MSSFYIRGLNSCVMRNQNISSYREYLLNAGYLETQNEKDADIILLWTCAFREDMANNSIRKVSELSLTYPEKKIYATGCMPDILPDKFRGMDNVLTIPWKEDVELLDAYFFTDEKIKKNKCMRWGGVYSESPNKREGAMFLDSFIKLLISEGCNEKCTYCSERLAFPQYYSFPQQALVSEAKKRIHETGNNIIALMADSPGEYGCDSGNETIISLIRELCNINDEVKIVIHNMNPAFFLSFYDDFKKLIQEGRIHHLNLPIQSANDRVLQVMGRRYTKNDLDYIFDSLLDWNLCKYDTHVIAGFPTERPEEFDETIDFLINKRIAYVLASPCMIVPGSLIYNDKHQVSETDKRSRLEKLEQKLRAAGVIVNTPYSSLASKRIREINER